MTAFESLPFKTYPGFSSLCWTGRSPEFRYMSHRHVLFGQETNNAVKHMAQFIWCPRSQIQPRNFTGPWVFFTKLAVKNIYREPEPYDLWYLSSTWDQTQDPQFRKFLFFFFFFFEIFCAILFFLFFSYHCWEGERTTDFFCLFLFGLYYLVQAWGDVVKGVYVFFGGREI